MTYWMWSTIYRALWGSSTPTNFQPPLNDRVFILIGKSKSGKSTLGNLLSGKEQFEVVDPGHCISDSKTKEVRSIEITLHPGEVIGMNYDADNSLKIKVIDQPGMDDGNIVPKTHCSNLVNCLSKSNMKTFPTFLLVINLESDRFMDDDCSLLTKLSFMLTEASYSLFSHAVVVFSCADRVVDDINNKESLMQIVTKKCQNTGWGGLTEILEAVSQRCIFVNGTNTEARYRCKILGELFELSKSTLQIRFHGNNDFTAAYLQNKLGIKNPGILEEELYKLDYQFHPDRNLFGQWDSSMSEQLKAAIQSMIALGEGISSMAVLINLSTPFSMQMNELINQLPTDYTPEVGPRIGEQWWKHVFIVFQVYDDISGENTVEENIKCNPMISDLAGKASNRWTWVARDTSVRVCRDRITEMCLRVRQDTGGKVFINGTVLREFKEMMKQVPDTEMRTLRISDPTFQQRMAQGAIHYTESNNTFVTKFWGITSKCKISVSSMRQILRNTLLTRELARFNDQYRDPKAKVSFDEVLHFLDNT